MFQRSLLVLILITCSAHADERFQINKIETFYKAILAQTQKTPKEDILVAYDIDNTLLAMDHDLGSDQWFSWQANLMKKPKSTNLVAQTMEELLLIQGKILALVDMHPIEKETSITVAKIQSMGIKSIILTSRGPAFRSDTEYEFKRAHLNFIESSIGPQKGYPGTFTLENIKEPREMSFMNGIVMGNGQNKGEVLKGILNLTKAQFKTIFFLDDTLKNIENVEVQMGPMVELYTYHYTYEEPRVKAFEKDPSQAVKEWQAMDHLLSNELKPLH